MDINRYGEPFMITGNWKIQSKQLKEKYSQLTDLDLMFETGKETELLNRLEIRLRKRRGEVIDILKRGLAFI
jgi:hypothetical protein